MTGANSGTGEASAAAFQEAGAKVFGILRRPDALEAAKARHPKIRWVLAEVSKAGQAMPAVECVVREAGRLDVVVNNAGLFVFAPLEQSTNYRPLG